jgi:arylsulfatase A-like enzyme
VRIRDDYEHATRFTSTILKPAGSQFRTQCVEQSNLFVFSIPMTSMASASNVLMVVLDTVRKDHLTPYGYTRPTTPVLATFAEEATVFEEAVAPAPWTLPVHASLFTGLYPSQHGADQETPYLDGVTTLAETLSTAGYDTACYSSNAWITPYTRLTDGFDDVDNFFRMMPGDLLSGPLSRGWRTLNDDDRLQSIAEKLVSLGNAAHEYLASGETAASKTPAVIDRIQAFVDDADGRWFAFANLMDAHLPYNPPEEYVDEFAPGVDPADVCQNSKEYNAGACDIDSQEWDAIRGLYDAELAHMDEQLGRLFAWLRDRGEWADTTVIVCADHGELHGEHDLYGHEFCLYDPLINVPLLIKHSEMSPSRRRDSVELLDLYHTILDAADVVGGESLSSGDVAVARDLTRSLLRPEYRQFGGIENPDPGQRAGPDGAFAFVEYSRPVVELTQLEAKATAAGVELDEQSRFYSRMRAARRPDAKYVRIDRVPDEAYRLDRDPDETANLATALDDCVCHTERALRSFEAAVGGAWTAAADDGAASIVDDAASDPLAEIDERARERLRELGYTE